VQYQYVSDRVNYEDYAAGRVLYTQAGMTSFPVRLASEIFQRCAAVLDKPRLHVYDPCAGSAYLLTVLGFLHSDRIASLWAADVSNDAMLIAQRNLSLLTLSGLEQRQHEIEIMLHDYGKISHAKALTSIDRLRQQLPQPAISSMVWTANALQPPLAPNCVDLLITDVPYGDVVAWDGTVSDNPIYDLLEAHYPIMARPSVVAIVSDKVQKAAHPQYQRLLHDTLGKRRITILQPK
jgi:23S rRNA (guanine2535-N1)-methyltransferase